MNIQELMLYGIVGVCLFNLFRMAGYLIISDMHTVSVARRKAKLGFRPLPTISVIIPAHNEESSIGRTLAAMRKVYYPATKLEIIVVNDGSTDKTVERVEKIAEITKGALIRLIDRPSLGKAAALNYAIKHKARGSLIMCLDADSHLDRWALLNAVWHFQDKDVMALSINVNIVEDGTLLGLMQRIEYIVNYHMKKGQDYMGLQYILGGVGSMFRRTLLERVKFYDTNTMTEDIDLTMKIFLSKKRHEKIAYAADSISYTEPVHTLRELMVQRFRWKYGRSQTFLKHASLFFSRNSEHRKRISWFMLPYVIVQDIVFLTEPIILGYFFYVILRYGDLGVLSMALALMTIYLLISLWSSRHLTVRERLRLSYYVPPMYFLTYILTYVEYYALIKALIDSRGLRGSLAKKHTKWTSPKRHIPVTTQ